MLVKFTRGILDTPQRGLPAPLAFPYILHPLEGSRRILRGGGGGGVYC